MKLLRSHFTHLRRKVKAPLLIVIILLYFCIFLNYSFNNLAEKDSELVRDPSSIERWEHEDWQSLGHPCLNFWIYSAYSFDEKHVVIIGSAIPFRHAELYVVHYLFYYSKDTGKNEEKVRGHLKVVPREWAKNAATLINCSLDATSKNGVPQPRPRFVSVLLGTQSRNEARLPIIYRNFNVPPPYKFSVCVLPLYGYNGVFHFLEWLEFYRIMGVEHFTFHNLSIGPATSCIMKHYGESVDGVPIKVKPWKGYTEKMDTAMIIMAATNECWYSHKGLSKYMIFVDVDEFILPHERFPDYHSLLYYLENRTTSRLPTGNKIGEYSFRNGFFIKSRDKDPTLGERCGTMKKDLAQFTACQNLWTMQFVEREPLNMWKDRTKYIGRPEAVKIGGNHFVHQFEPGWERVRVDDSIAYLRHYRQFDEGPSTEVHRIPLELGTSLAKNVAKKLEYFIKVCALTDSDVFSSGIKEPL